MSSLAGEYEALLSLRTINSRHPQHHIHTRIPRDAGDTFFLDPFALRQWDDPKYSGTRVSFDKAEFVRKVHEHYISQGSELVDGYAPFCKHVFVPNFVGAKLGALEITDANIVHLKSGYKRRRPEELPVLSRWFNREDVEPIPGTWWLPNPPIDTSLIDNPPDR